MKSYNRIPEVPCTPLKQTKDRSTNCAMFFFWIWFLCFLQNSWFKECRLHRHHCKKWILHFQNNHACSESKIAWKEVKDSFFVFSKFEGIKFYEFWDKFFRIRRCSTTTELCCGVFFVIFTCKSIHQCLFVSSCIFMFYSSYFSFQQQLVKAKDWMECLFEQVNDKR